MNSGRVPRLLLIGGGHAHLHVLEALARKEWPPADTGLISLDAGHHYSGMVPGWLEGRYRESELRFDLPALCRAAGVEFVEGRADSVEWSGSGDPGSGAGSGAGRVIAATGERHPFDLLSLDVGSAAAGLDTPGVRSHAWSVRPMIRARELRRAVDRAIEEVDPGASVRVGVVGAGAAGLEISLTLAARIRAAGARSAVELIEAGSRLLPGYDDRVRALASAILVREGVGERTGFPVSRVTSDGVVGPDGDPLPLDLVVWTAGAAAPEFLARTGLPLSPDGFLRVDAALRSVDGRPAWGAGDCIALDGHPEMPRAGVYAVRQGPVLARNLKAALQAWHSAPAAGSSPAERPGPVPDADSYTPQTGFLSLLNTGDGRALLRWRGVVLHARWAMALKDRIDRKFMGRFHRVASRGVDA